MAHKSTLILVFSFLAVFTQAQTTTDSTYIDAQIDGLPAGKVRLVGTYGDQNYLADSTDCDATGHFVLRRKKALPSGTYTFLLPGVKNFTILLDKDDQRLRIRAKAADITNTLQAEGSLNTQLFYESQRFQSAQEPELNQLGETMRKFPATAPEHQTAKARQKQLLDERKAYLDGIYKKHPDLFFTKFKIAGQNPEWLEFRKPNGDIDTVRQVVSYRSRMFDNVDFNDTRLLYTPVIFNKLKRYIKDFTPQQPDSLIKASDELIQKVLKHPEYFQFFVNWIGVTYENGKTNVMDGEAVYVHIVKKYFTPELAYWSKPDELEKLQKHVWEMEASLLGKKGPDVQARDANGQMKSIYEMTEPIIVVFMFSPNCEHCQKDAPVIQKLYEKWKTRGVNFYGIAVQTEEQEWKDFVKKNGFTFTNVFDPTNRAIYAKYYVDITPELYVLNKDRIIVGKNLKPEQLEIIFEREFKKMQKK